MAKSTQAWLDDFDLAVEKDDYNMRVEKLASKIEEAHKARELGGRGKHSHKARDRTRTKPENLVDEESTRTKTPNQQMEDDFAECMVKSGFWFA